MDSYWAHRASGIRGALIRIIEKTDLMDNLHIPTYQEERFMELLENGYKILEKAAREIPENK